MKLKKESTSYSKHKNKKNKLVINFDENARREFLTGFHKRNVQKKLDAIEIFEKKLKAEKKRIKEEAKEAYKRLLLLPKSIPELNLKSEEIDMGTHSVQITELSAAELAKNNHWIGINEVQYDEPQETKSRPIHDLELEGMKLKPGQDSNDPKSYLKSSKFIKKMLRQHSTLNVKNSKIFKQKAKLERMKFIKKKKREAKKRKKLLKQKMESDNKD